jgi:type II secretory pathway pseudopilin PulG
VPFALLVVTLIAGGLGLLLLLNTASAANEVRRHDLAQQDARIAAQLQELQNEVAASAAPSNLARAADELGMVPAGNPAFLVEGSDGSIRVLGSPGPATGAPTNPHPHPTTKSSTAPKTTAHTTTAAKSTATSSKSSPNSSRTSTKTSTTSSSKTKSASTSPPPSPTPTPTPTVTLPGGNR